MRWNVSLYGPIVTDKMQVGDIAEKREDGRTALHGHGRINWVVKQNRRASTWRDAILRVLTV